MSLRPRPPDPAPDGMPTAALVTVGDELLSGRTIDTNAAWLGRRLGDMGVPVVRRLTVGDDVADIQDAVAAALHVAELVLVTGGLGPTPDDVTRDAVAALLERPLRPDPDVLEGIRERFREAGVERLPDVNHRVALVPEGARILPNPAGTAPGLVLADGARWIVLLPGVPRELKAIVDGGLEALVAEAFPGRLRAVTVRQIHTTGIAESTLSQAIAEALPEGTGPVRLAFLPGLRGVDLRLTLTGVGGDEAARSFDAVEARLAGVLAPWRFDAEGGGDLAEAVLVAVRRTGHTLALAESCTGGLVAKRLTDIPGASDVVIGGVVAYADQVKVDILGVPTETLAAHGAVSAEVARAMALGVIRRLGASAGLAVTGVAGPGGGSEAKPVGTVCYAAALGTGVAVRTARFPGDRESVRERSAQAALALLLRLLDGSVPPDGAEPAGSTIVS